MSPINSPAKQLEIPFKISPTHDTPFKFLFAQPNESEELLIGLLNYTLKLKGERRIVSLTYQNVELSPLRHAGRKLILDLLVTDQGNITYNIEIQRENTASIIHRALFQQGRVVGAQLNTRETFDDLNPIVIVLFCRYSIFPDPEVVRLFQLVPFQLDEARGRQTLPCRIEHFDPENTQRYHQFKRRVEQADQSLDLFRIYLIELDKDLGVLDPDQEACIQYLMTDYTREDPMNSTSPRTPQYHIPEGASPEVRQWINQAQKRLERFAALPEQRLAYERELLELMEHNTLIKKSHQEGIEEGEARGRAEGEARGRAEGEARGRANTLKTVITRLRISGMDDETIIQSLQLTSEEQALLLIEPKS